MTALTPYAKAIVGALIAGLGALATALTDDTVSNAEWVAVALAAAVSLGAVFGTPNRDPHAEHQDESVQPPEAGRIDGAIALGIVAVVMAGLILIFR